MNMKAPLCFRIVLLGLALAVSSCANYSSVSEKRPKFRAVTPAGRIITRALDHPAKQPEAQIGSFIDAAATATAILEKNPDDQQARKDYNFAVGRIFEVIHTAGLQPWKAPLICPSASGNWSFSVATDGKPEHNPSYFRILPADRYQFRGKLVHERTMKDGLGSPMVIASVRAGFDPTKYDPFIQGKSVYYGVTEVLQFKGRNCIAAYIDPLATETVNFAGHTYPVAADFTAPLALALAELAPRKTEIQRLVHPEEFAASARLARLQPYDPRKIPILCIHGLGDSQATWAPLIESLRGDATIRQNYQIWFYSYPTGYPYPLMAAVLRKQMDAINAYHAGHKKIVVIGHSMGGMIARTLITDSGMKIWNAYYDMPPDKLPVTPETRKVFASAFIFQHRPEISRVIYASASHRGADKATGVGGKLLAGFIGGNPTAPELAGDQAKAISLMKPDYSGDHLKRIPNSIDALKPGNRFVITMDTIPPTPGVPYNSIIGDRGKGGNLNRTPPVSTDGVVPYWSSHLDGAESELIVPSGHWSNQNPQAIAEVKRILIKHLGKK
ncbi:MAG: alpha/beta hydrolase [Verrucomicrobia bacterium]|nr:alpha/beta hydrolase [Verrucomicrobiota bacterium]